MDNTASSMGQVRQFKLHTSDWILYKAHLDNYFMANNITNSSKKRAVFLTMLDEEAYKLMLYLCQPRLPENKDFEALVALFDYNLVPSKSVFVERHKFYKTRKLKCESVEDWAMRVKSFAANCEFGQNLDEHLRDKFIFGFEEEQQFLFLGYDTSLTFEEAVKMVDEKVGNSEGYYRDFREYFANSVFDHKVCDSRKFLYVSDVSHGCLFYPCVVIDGYRHYH